MKFDALRSSVARLFETAATLVSPQTEALEGQPAPALAVPDKLMDDIEDMVRKAIPGADVMVRRIGDDTEVPRALLQDIVDDANKAADAAIKPPPEDNFPWETWAKIRDERPIPHGWAYCRIANRFNMASRGLPDTCKFTFGIVRGTFGLWSKPYSVCSFDFEAGPIPGYEKAERILISVCHLPSGTNMGLFFDVNLAAEACELMDKTHTDWSHIDHNDPRAWGVFFNQMVTLWAHVGIQQSMSHAHNLDGEGPAMVIFERTPETMAMFRPLVLS